VWQRARQARLIIFGVYIRTARDQEGNVGAVPHDCGFAEFGPGVLHGGRVGQGVI